MTLGVACAICIRDQNPDAAPEVWQALTTIGPVPVCQVHVGPEIARQSPGDPEKGKAEGLLELLRAVNPKELSAAANKQFDDYAGGSMDDFARACLEVLIKEAEALAR